MNSQSQNLLNHNNNITLHLSMSAKSLLKVVSKTYSTPTALKNAVNLDATYSTLTRLNLWYRVPGSTCPYLFYSHLIVCSNGRPGLRRHRHHHRLHNIMYKRHIIVQCHELQHNIILTVSEHEKGGGGDKDICPCVMYTIPRGHAHPGHFFRYKFSE